MVKKTNGTTSPMNTGALKRVFSVLIVLLLASVLMVGAGSAETTTGVAQIGETSYATLLGESGAFAAAQSGDIITLISNVDETFTEEVKITNPITLNLNGHALNASINSDAGGSKYFINVSGSSGHLTITGSGIFNITNATGAGKTWARGILVDGGKLTINANDDTTFNATDRVIEASNKASVSINGGSFKSPRFAILAFNEGTTIEINGGTVEAGICALYSTSKSTISTIDGKFTAPTVAMVFGQSSLSTKGGTFESPSKDEATGDYLVAVDNSSLTVNGGTFNAKLFMAPPYEYAGQAAFLIQGEYADPDATRVSLTGAKVTATGPAIQTNGQQQYSEYEIKIENSNLISSDVALYLPSKGTVTLHNTDVSGLGGITIKAGQLTISGDSVISSIAENNVAAYFNNNGANGDEGSAIVLEKGSLGTGDSGYYGDLIITIQDTAQVKSENGVGIRNYITDENLGGVQKVEVTVKDQAKVIGAATAADIAYQNYTNDVSTTVKYSQNATFIFPATYGTLKVQYDNVTDLTTGIHTVTLDLNGGSLDDTFTITKGFITLPETAPTKGTDKFSSWLLGSEKYLMGEKVDLDIVKPVTFIANYQTPATLTVDGDLAVDASQTVPSEGYKLTATLSSGTVPITWEIIENDGIIEKQDSSIDSEFIFKLPSTVKAGTATIKVTAGAIDEKEVIVTVTKPTVPDLPISDINTEVNGDVKTTTIEVTSPTSDQSVSVSPDNTVLTIKDTANGVTMEIKGTVTSTAANPGDAGTYTVTNPTAVTVTHDSKQAGIFTDAANDGLDAGITFSFVVNLENATDSVNTSSNPTDEMVDTIKNSGYDLSKYKLVSVATAWGDNVSKVNGNISSDGVDVIFNVSKSWIDKVINGDVNRLKAFHISGSSVKEILTGKILGLPFTENGVEYYQIIFEGGKGFSSYVLAVDTYVAPSNPSSSSSSSGSSVWLQEPATPTEQPTQTPTEQPTDKPTDTVPTDIPSTQPTATPASPGFGILAVLAGLGAVAALRRQ